MSSSTVHREQTAAGFWLESEPQIVVINWAALASMTAPMAVELLPTWAATAEKGRFSSGVNRYWAEGSTFFPPKSTNGNVPPFVSSHSVSWACVGVCSGA